MTSLSSIRGINFGLEIPDHRSVYPTKVLKYGECMISFWLEIVGFCTGKKNPRKPINLISVLSLIFKSDVTELSGNKELERWYLSFSLHKKKKGRERLTKLPIDKARKVF